LALDSLASEAGLPAAALADSVHFAWADAWFFDQPERAVRRLDAALALHPLAGLPESDRPYFAVTRAYATAGRPDRARPIVQQMLAIGDTALLRDRRQTAHRLRGEIALADGRPDIALAEFRQVDMLPDGPRTSNGDVVFIALARAFDLASQPDSAIAYFERYLTTPSVSRANDAIYLAGTYKRLGELYEARGDRAKAASAFARFVDLWQDADPEVQPKVTSVRERLARLRDVERR
jgi:tetratricopeptide (TPR) repeat protein